MPFIGFSIYIYFFCQRNPSMSPVYKHHCECRMLAATWVAPPYSCDHEVSGVVARCSELHQKTGPPTLIINPPCQ